MVVVVVVVVVCKPEENPLVDLPLPLISLCFHRPQDGNDGNTDTNQHHDMSQPHHNAVAAGKDWMIGLSEVTGFDGELAKGWTRCSRLQCDQATYGPARAHESAAFCARMPRSSLSPTAGWSPARG